MNSDPATLSAPPRQHRIGLLLIPLAAVVWTLVIMGTTGALKLVPVILAMATVFGWLVWRWPGVMVAMMPMFIVPPQFAKLFAYEVFMGLAAVLLFYIGWNRRATWVWRISALEIFVFALLLWGMFTIWWVRDSWWWLFGIRKYLMGFVALWVAWRLWRFVDPELLLVGVPAGASALALVMMVKATGVGFFEAVAKSHIRVQASDAGWGRANFLAAIVVLMLPTGLYVAMNGSKPFYRAIGWASIPLTAILVTLGASRGGAVMVVVISLYAMFRSKIRPWMAISAAALMVAGLSIGPGGKLLMSRFTSAEDMTSVVIRLMYFREAWHRLVTYWPRGIGLGQGVGFPYDRLWNDDPHNYWLVVGSELGLVGILIWIGILIVLWRMISRIKRDPATQHLGRALQLTFIISQLNLMFEPTFQGLQYHALFYWLFGCYFGYYEYVRQKATTTGAPLPEPDADHGRAPEPRPA